MKLNENEIKDMIRSILAEGSTGISQNNTGTDNTQNATQVVIPTNVEEGYVDDVSEINIREQYLVENAANPEAFKKAKLSTPARLGIGRAGSRYKTTPYLRFRADHAAAQDAVFKELTDDFIESQGWVKTKTKVEDKDEFITRPDIGRQFDEEDSKKISDTVGDVQVAIIVCDGLSSVAVETNASDTASAIKQGLEGKGITYNDTLPFIEYCRVGAMDQLGEHMNADIICFLIGERPGLVTAESMSAYIGYQPKPGYLESSRTVVSNIHEQGTPSVEAGAYIADVLENMLKYEASGIELKRLQAEN